MQFTFNLQPPFITTHLVRRRGDSLVNADFGALFQNETSVCIAGKNRISVSVVEALSGSYGSLIVVPTEGDTGKDTWQPSLVKKAKELAIPVVNIGDCQAIENLLFLSLEFDRIIIPSEFKSKRLFNLHFSLLPAYKGCFTSIWPIIRGEKYSGVTLHRIDYGIDTGDIVDQIAFDLPSSMTARVLYEKYQDLGIQLTMANVESLLRGSEESTPQRPADSTYFSRKSLSSLDFEIDFRASADQIRAHVNGLFFPEFQTATFAGTAIRAVTILKTPSRAKPGTILACSSDGPIVATIDFDVSLHRYWN